MGAIMLIEDEHDGFVVVGGMRGDPGSVNELTLGAHCRLRLEDFIA
jgi:hypothetical protein